MLQSDLCGYSDEYIRVNDRDKCNRSLILKNNAPFISCISKITNSLIDNAEDLDIVTPIFNLIEYIKIIQRHLLLYGIITKIFQLII